MFFTSLIGAIPGGIAQGLMWALLALGVFITYKILDFADLTVDGSLATGGCVAVMLISVGVNPFLATFLAFLSGCVAGLITALLNTKLKIPAILSGILTMSALYSVNKRILGGRANVSIYGKPTVNGAFASLFKLNVIDDKNLLSIISCVLLLCALIAVLYWFFGTEFGCSIRATGSNPTMAKALGINTDNTKIFALMLSNGFAGLSGALIAQHNFSADVNMASGAVVIGLASVVIGELLIPEKITFWLKLTFVVVGSLIYRFIFVFAIQLGLNSDDLKLIASVIIIIALCAPTLKKYVKSKRKGANKNA